MSRRNPKLGELLIMAPWWVSAALAVASFISLRVVLPAIGGDNQVLKIFVRACASIAWVPALLFSVLAVISVVIRKNKRALLDDQTGADSLRALSWKEFEWLVGEAYRRQGYAVEESLGGGADGGIDLMIRRDGGTWLVQCKQWKVQAVGAPIIREIFGLVTHHRANGAIIITSGRFTREAMTFAKGKTLELIDGPALFQLVKSVKANREPTTVSPAPVQSTAPSCPKCGNPMVERVARKGANAGNSFWGCSSFPKCNGVRNTT
ncbi:MAG TPA: restriction endonuclease [Rariglobus sp.]|jgi:restriction system protein|nr:restriction endonuclease [Rariglobus sp.]